MERARSPRDRQGFTLIELLIVIAIITILAAGLTVAVVGVLDRTKRNKTESTVNMLLTALGSYKNTFGRYPPVYGGPGLPGGAPASSAPSNITSETLLANGVASVTYGNPGAGVPERNRAFRIYLEYAWPGVREAPFIDASSDIGRGDPVTGGLNVYIDAWSQPLVFNCPGDNHAFDKNVDGQFIKGRYDSGRTGAYSSGEETRWAIDIYSYGPNNLDNYGAHDGTAGGTADDTHGDDVISWGPQVVQ